MEKFIEKMFPCSSTLDKLHIVETLNKLGVDSPSDLRLVDQSDLTGQLKVVYIRKLMEVRKLMAAVEKGVIDEQNSETCEESDVTVTSPADQTTKNLALATGVLGTVGAAAVPLAIFAALFPPITLPIAVGIGITTGVVAAAAAGTGIATAVMVHKKKEAEEKEDEENEDPLVEEIHRVDGQLKKLL